MLSHPTTTTPQVRHSRLHCLSSHRIDPPLDPISQSQDSSPMALNPRVSLLKQEPSRDSVLVPNQSQQQQQQLSPQQLTPQHSQQNLQTGNSLDRNYSSLAYSLRRTLSRVSKRSYRSNISSLNRKNLSRFGKAKIVFLVFNAIFTFFALAILLTCAFTYAETYSAADIFKIIAPSVLLPLTTVASIVMSIVGFIGFVGAFAHRKNILTVFNVSCWVVLGLFIAIGYIGYRDANNTQFENDLALKWDTWTWQRGVVETRLNCCGYYSLLDRPFPNAVCAVPVIPSPTTTTITTTTIAPAATNVVPPPAASPSPTDGEARRFLIRRQTASSPCHDPFVIFASSSMVLVMLASNHIYD
ncbi:hypothetical protein BJ742DRAFT_314581 [Cladochytrium replicatum]|nr:hypothetical protein BJ742DRAFT_314581 [Cladochytrium replicatum]